MLAELGSLRIRARSKSRLELGIGHSTQLMGILLAMISAVAAIVLLPISLKLSAATAGLAGFGGIVASVRRTMVFDLDDGVLRIENGLLGLRTRSSVPLFHLRAVVVEKVGDKSRHIAYLQRRVGQPIELDDGSSAAPLLELAHAVSEVTEIRMVYRAA